VGRFEYNNFALSSNKEVQRCCTNREAEYMQVIKLLESRERLDKLQSFMLISLVVSKLVKQLIKALFIGT
jgi:hypothetical protein